MGVLFGLWAAEVWAVDVEAGGEKGLTFEEEGCFAGAPNRTLSAEAGAEAVVNPFVVEIGCEVRLDAGTWEVIVKPGWTDELVVALAGFWTLEDDGANRPTCDGVRVAGEVPGPGVWFAVAGLKLKAVIQA